MTPPLRPPVRLVPLIDQFDWGRERLVDRMTGPDSDAGGGTRIPVPALTDAEYLWEPVPGCWSIRRRSDGPGTGATMLAGAGEWGRDRAENPQPYPPPLTTIAWRLGHLSEMMALRADHMNGSHALRREDYRFTGYAGEAISAFRVAAASWREALISTDEGGLDTAGRSTYPYGSDPEDPFIGTAWWVNQELLHHGAEIALLRDLYRVMASPR